MKLHHTTTKFNCGVDLHTKNMYICVMDKEGIILLHRYIKGNDMNYFIEILQPYLPDLTICCESTINWYVLRDFCEKCGIKFVLGHAFYMRAISHAKTKNDKVDSERISSLLRSNMLPEAFSCPKDICLIRDLLRRRLRLVQKRTDLKTSLTTTLQMHGIDSLSAAEKTNKTNRRTAYLDRIDEDLISLTFDGYLNIIEAFDIEIHRFEKRIIQETRSIHPELLKALMSVPGIGTVTAMTIIYESGDVERFSGIKHYCSYARVACNHSISDNKVYGSRGRKMGNPYLKWVYEQAAVHAARVNPSINKYKTSLTSKHGKAKARNIISHRIARFCYYSLKKSIHFDLNEFFKGKESMIVKKKEK